jgi:hemoglobin/transferrin/lactoferrin receptor protein
MIVRTPTGKVIDDEYEVTKKNSGDGYVGGVELDGCYLLGRGFSALGVFTWMTGKVDTYPTSDAVTSSEYIDRLMPPTGMFGLRWNSEEKHHLKIEGLCRFAGKADKLSTRDKSDTSRIPPGGTPGYAVYDLRASADVCENITLSLALENIADEDYRIHGSGVNEVGRNVVLALQTVF